MLDNLLDNQNMDADTRNHFLKSIYREITNINFFIQALLKLSKFDANTIRFNSKKEKIRDIVEEAKQNVAMICDLKNIEIEVEMLEGNGTQKHDGEELMRKRRHSSNKTEPKVICDLKWQCRSGYKYFERILWNIQNQILKYIFHLVKIVCIQK